MIEILKTQDASVYELFGFPSSSVAMAASDSGEVLGAGAVSICGGYAVIEGIAMKKEYQMFNMEFGIGKALLNMLDLSGVRYVCADNLDERLAASLRFKTDYALPTDCKPDKNYKYFLCLDGYFTSGHCE